MASYPYNRTINITGLGPRGLEPGEELMESKFYPLAAKEKNKGLFPDILSGSRLKEYFYPLAAKEKKSVNNQKLLRMLHGAVFSKRVP
jgi:hypothetical protein